MPRCLNDAARSFKPGQPSPSGYGYCAHAEPPHSRRRGCNDKVWETKPDVNGRLAWRATNQDDKDAFEEPDWATCGVAPPVIRLKSVLPNKAKPPAMKSLPNLQKRAGKAKVGSCKTGCAEGLTCWPETGRCRKSAAATVTRQVPKKQPQPQALVKRQPASSRGPNTRQPARPPAVKRTVSALQAMIRAAAEAYYNRNPVMSDRSYDRLVDELESLNPRDPVLTEIGAPVAHGAVPLPYAMMSLDKVKRGTNKLAAWASAHPGPYVVSDKLDGTSAMIVWSPDPRELPRMFRRGTGTHGADISHLLRYVVSPSTLRGGGGAVRQNSRVAVRGELVVGTSDAARLGRYKNARTHANALATQGAGKAEDYKPLRFVAYELVHPRTEKSDQMNVLRSLGLECVTHTTTPSATDASLGSLLAKRRAASRYDIDGLVVEAAGVHVLTARNPKYAIAFKDPSAAEVHETTVTSVEWNLTKSGNLVPVAMFEPVHIGGTTIRRASAHNARRVVEWGIGKGAIIEVVRAGDVIPKIQGVKRKAEPSLPTQPHRWNATKVHLIPL